MPVHPLDSQINQSQGREARHSTNTLDIANPRLMFQVKSYIANNTNIKNSPRSSIWPRSAFTTRFQHKQPRSHVTAHELGNAGVNDGKHRKTSSIAGNSPDFKSKNPNLGSDPFRFQECLSQGREPVLSAPLPVAALKYKPFHTHSIFSPANTSLAITNIYHPPIQVSKVDDRLQNMVFSSYHYAAAGKPVIKTRSSNAPKNSTPPSSSSSNTSYSTLGHSNANSISNNASPASAVPPLNSSNSAVLHNEPQSQQSAPAKKTAPAPPPAPKIQVEMTQYLICDSSVTNLFKNEKNCVVVQEGVEITGYELYIVEQWACERKLNCVIISYTGNPHHTIVANIVALPQKKQPDTHLENSDWKEKITAPESVSSPFELFPATACAYFEELYNNHVHPKTTEKGTIYVSNLSSFPSNLNLIPVPKGNLESVRVLFAVNENIKRTGCGGRSVLTLSQPSVATEDKFRQLFKTNEKVPIEYAVRELILLVQISLFYFDLFNPQYIDGLLCNETLKATNHWWERYGIIHYHTRFSDRAYLSPQTVSGIIGLVTGARNRIASVLGNSKTSKDPFDVEFFLMSLRQFQKHQHIFRSSRLDSGTMETLYMLTSTKAAGNNGNFGPSNAYLPGGDFFGIVKNTMKEVSGKPYVGLADVETLEIGLMKTFLQGSRARYLWLGRGNACKMLTHPTQFTQDIRIPFSSLCPSEISTSTDSKWGVARRALPMSKKPASNFSNTASGAGSTNPNTVIGSSVGNNSINVISGKSNVPEDGNSSRTGSSTNGSNNSNGSSTVPASHFNTMDPTTNSNTNGVPRGSESANGKQNFEHKQVTNGSVIPQIGNQNVDPNGQNSNMHTNNTLENGHPSKSHSTKNADEEGPTEKLQTHKKHRHHHHHHHRLKQKLENGDQIPRRDRLKRYIRAGRSSGNNQAIFIPIQDGTKNTDFNYDGGNAFYSAGESDYGLSENDDCMIQHSEITDTELCNCDTDLDDEESGTGLVAGDRALGSVDGFTSKHKSATTVVDMSLKGPLTRPASVPDLPSMVNQGFRQKGYKKKRTRSRKGSKSISGCNDTRNSSRQSLANSPVLGNKSRKSSISSTTNHTMADTNSNAHLSPDSLGVYYPNSPRLRSSSSLVSLASLDSFFSNETRIDQPDLDDSAKCYQNDGCIGEIWQSYTYKSIDSAEYKLAALRRCQSYSLIEKHLDCVQIPEIQASQLEPNPECIAQSYRVSCAFNYKVQEWIQSFKQEKMAYMKLDDKLRTYMRKSLEKKVANMDKNIRVTLQDDVALQRGLDDLEKLTARLQYEARTLDAKIRDVEDAVVTFATRVDMLEERMFDFDYQDIEDSSGSESQHEIDSTDFFCSKRVLSVLGSGFNKASRKEKQKLAREKSLKTKGLENPAFSSGTRPKVRTLSRSSTSRPVFSSSLHSKKQYNDSNGLESVQHEGGVVESLKGFGNYIWGSVAPYLPPSIIGDASQDSYNQDTKLKSPLVSSPTATTSSKAPQSSSTSKRRHRHRHKRAGSNSSLDTGPRSLAKTGAFSSQPGPTICERSRSPKPRGNSISSNGSTSSSNSTLSKSNSVTFQPQQRPPRGISPSSIRRSFGSGSMRRPSFTNKPSGLTGMDRLREISRKKVQDEAEKDINGLGNRPNNDDSVNDFGIRQELQNNAVMSDEDELYDTDTTTNTAGSNG